LKQPGPPGLRRLEVTLRNPAIRRRFYTPAWTATVSEVKSPTAAGVTGEPRLAPLAIAGRVFQQPPVCRDGQVRDV